MSEFSLFFRAMLKERKDILLSILGGFLAGIAGVVLFSASGYLIAKTVFVPPLYTLILLTSLVKILGLVRAASRYGERLFSHRATFSLLSRLRTDFFARLVPLAPGILNRKRSGDLLARIVGDIESLQFYFLRVAYPPIIVVSVFLATVLFASFFSIWIALLLMLGMLITAFAVPAFVRIGQHKTDGRVRRQRAALSSETTELLYGFIDLKVYGRLQQCEQALLAASGELTEAQQSDALHLLRGQSLHSFVTFFVSWGVLVLGAFLIANGSMAGVFLAMLIMASMTVFDESAALATLPAYKRDSAFAANRLGETFAAAESNTDGKADSKPAAKLERDAAVSVELDNVHFRYAEDWRPVLSGVSLQFEAGSKTAIVGPSGSGKTSILELILKLHAPTEGRIVLNGTPIGELDAEDLWSRTNVVLQAGHFFRGTVRDNLLLEDDSRSEQELLNVLEQVNLPGKRLDDLILEKGENLSDGEKQRLAIARALLKSGRLWLLDEPTSSLDYVTERRVLEAMLERAKDDTLVMVCHRLAGLERMDQIVVVDRGVIVETGTYDQLMQIRGYFYEMKQIERQMIGSFDDAEA
ncbi:thiol reductant ABC exporter subunit CydC [Saccharibacillus kuerlensis]|uniref:Thiol reductant ABC exporter subunit CydC n=1 Tax=Saccharibacillus kuerlensis TaxID=459527 RepID=A0ABQ2L576_9BACL|nr:thiol reductant ABC exporter subunit CydC [Saccharibacillus kuerlensis]GGO03116.1 thiol reductant ABC exporter subunit CydC [Saccharibacillus kuerlensis]